MIPIFCINLPRAIKRKEYIEEEWINKLGFDITFWKGYDRRDIENNKFVYSYDKQVAINSTGRQLSHGEIACATSYCMLYEYLINNNYEEVVIMEDDIIPLIKNKNELFNIIDQGKAEFPEADIMLLHEYPISDQYKNIVYAFSKNIFSMCNESPWGNQLFHIQKSAILEVYSLLKTMSMPADYPQKLLCKQKRVIIVNKALCDHEWRGSTATTYIGNQYRCTNRKFIE